MLRHKIFVLAFLVISIWGGMPSTQIAAHRTSEVDFSFDGTRVSDITVNGQPLLGPRVGTGGIYLIGSLDGSDAQGLSVSSVGGVNGYMHSDNPARVPSPPYQLRFTRVDERRLRFVAEVGPTPADFAVMGMALDFGKQAVDRFAFDGNRYRLQCTGLTDGPRTGSQAPFSAIPQGCEIRNANGVLLGKVGAALTDRPTAWGEVEGSTATVRVNVLSSSHYKSMVFVNHFGTNNLGFDFGAMRQGEKARVEGEIVVNNWAFEAEKDLAHQIGRRESDGWGVNVRDTPNQFMSYGPYSTNIAAGKRTATFRLMLDNVTADNLRILTIDVYDAETKRILSQSGITRRQFNRAFAYQDFGLTFSAPPGQRLEFRTFWHGSSYVRQDKVLVL